MNTLNNSGSLRLYLGCMYSGKTSELIREYTRYQKIGKKVICINYSFDTRYGNDEYVYSHNLDKIECIKCQSLMELSHDLISSYDVILINEGQFFKDILEFCLKYCDEFNKHIIVCGLDGDYLRKPFGQMNDLISLADEITKLKAFCTECNDGTPALFTWRLSKETKQVSIGNDYVPLCRKHYLKLSKTDFVNDLDKTLNKSIDKKVNEIIDEEIKKSLLKTSFEVNYFI